jgi:hypothetical protein
VNLHGDRRRVRDERERTRRVPVQAAGQREAGRRGVDEDRPAVLDEPDGLRGDRLFLGLRLPEPLRPVGRHLAAGLARAGGSRAPVYALDQSVAGEALEIPVHRDRSDVVVAGELADGGASVAMDSLQDLGSAEVGGHRGQDVAREAETRAR